jgi:hypothetical protein
LSQLTVRVMDMAPFISSSAKAYYRLAQRITGASTNWLLLQSGRSVNLLKLG